MGDSNIEPPAESVSPQGNTNDERHAAPRNIDLLPQVPPAVEHKRETTHCKPDQTPLWKIVLEVGAVAVGIAVALIYYGQLSVMRVQLGEIIRQYPELQKSAQAAKDSADVTKEALYSVQRAYVTFPPSPQITVMGLQSGTTVLLEMPIENSGATQAHALKDRVSCATPMGELPNNYTFPDKEGECGTPWAATGANVIPAKGSMLSPIVNIDFKIVQEFIQQNVGPWPNRIGAADHPTRNIVFYGWATYRDIFNGTPEHLSEFCRTLTTFILQPQTQKASWGYCPTHNCTDKDCPDYEERIKSADAAPTCCPKRWYKKPKRQ